MISVIVGFSLVAIFCLYYVATFYHNVSWLFFKFLKVASEGVYDFKVWWPWDKKEEDKGVEEGSDTYDREFKIPKYLPPAPEQFVEGVKKDPLKIFIAGGMLLEALFLFVSLNQVVEHESLQESITATGLGFINFVYTAGVTLTPVLVPVTIFASLFYGVRFIARFHAKHGSKIKSIIEKEG